jgi:transcriptional regulator with XRE-family HTH domain
MKDSYKKEMQRVATKIRMVREFRNFSQEYVSKKIGISQNAYSKIELGYSKISLDRFFHIAKILDVDVTELLGTKGS